MSSAERIPIMESFYSVQGEGFYSGRPAYFIRTAGCDVGCVWCDVKESWNRYEHPEIEIDRIVAAIQSSGTDFVVVTGGEPAMYDLTRLTREFHKSGMEIAMETSGAYPILGEYDWICLSPKKFKLPLEENYAKANELKMIIFNKHDLEWAEELRKKVRPGCKLYLQPEWDKSEKMLPLIIQHVKENTYWSISLQTHKFMNIP